MYCQNICNLVKVMSWSTWRIYLILNKTKGIFHNKNVCKQHIQAISLTSFNDVEM